MGHSNLPYRVVGSCRLSISVSVSNVVPKTRDHVTNDHVTIFYVDIQKLAFDSPSTWCSCHNL